MLVKYSRLQTTLVVDDRKLQMTAEDISDAANKIGYGCVKYADLKQHRMSDYQFAYDKMLDLRGNTV